MLTKFGKHFLPRMVPMAGAAFAPIEAEKAKKEWDAGNRGRAAAYGLGSLGAAAQATGNPFLMGLGNVAQIAPLALMAYDYANEKEAKP
jgi:hypothetical protein